jgi:hypothetical protein
MDTLTKEQMEWMNGYVPANIHDIYADGGIHIKPSHKGRFTEYKERTGKTTEEALHSPDPHVRQMANFARNAAKWKHQEGGTATGQNEEIMQLIQMYAQFVAQQSGQDPNQIYQQLMQQFQEMEPEQLQQAIEQMSSELQGAQQQEQENPQEQVQEQGMEEPMQEEMMAYGGPFRADTSLVPSTGFNNALVNANMLANPAYSPMYALSTMNNKPAKFLAGVMGAIAAPAGSALGYSALFNNNKSVNNTPAPAVDYQKVNNTDFTKMPVYNNNPKYNNTMVAKHGGELPYAQVGLSVEYPIPNEDLRSGYQSYTMTPNPNAVNIPTSGFSTPTEGMDRTEMIRNKRLMTETIADRKNWNRLAPERAAQDIRIQNFLNANPGSTTDDYFESTEYQNNVGTPGVGSTSREKLSGCAVNAPARAYGGELPHAQVGIPAGFNFNDPYGLQQERFGQTANYADAQQYGANFNARPLVQPLQPMSKPAVGVGIKTNLNMPSYQSKLNPNSVNVNKKTMTNVSGQQIANNALFGLKAFSNMLPDDNIPEPTYNTMDNPFMSNPLNAYGNYTTNVQAGADFFQPGKHVAAQSISKYGGQQNFASGGQYKVSHDELLQLLRDGAEIEFL